MGVKIYRIGFINCCAEENPLQQVTAQSYLLTWFKTQPSAIIDKPEELDCGVFWERSPFSMGI